jgi:hypothetical protein
MHYSNVHNALSAAHLGGHADDGPPNLISEVVLHLEPSRPFLPLCKFRMIA